MDKLLVAFLLLAWVVLSAFLSWVLLSITEERKNTRARQKLLQDIGGAIKHSQPAWEQLVEMAETDGLGAKTACELTRSLYRELLVGKNQEYEPHKALIESYLAEHKKAEPFEGLPTETRIHMERLREALAGHEQLLEPLTSQIRELVSVYEGDKKVQKRYTAWGFFLGLIGVIFAVYPYLNPPDSGKLIKQIETPSVRTPDTSKMSNVIWISV
jgi:hypothetical protein